MFKWFKRPFINKPPKATTIEVVCRLCGKQLCQHSVVARKKGENGENNDLFLCPPPTKEIYLKEKSWAYPGMYGVAIRDQFEEKEDDNFNDKVLPLLGIDKTKPKPQK